MEDRYEIQGKIGQGGIGSVHRAYDHKLKRQVAIKRILTSAEDPTLQDEATKQLLQESSALASLQHPHIVTILDVGLDEKGPYVVMELISGKTLDEIIETAPLAWQDFKQVAMQSLEALIAAQELGMIHSDLKPPNIMLTWLPSGTFQVKIVDFGLACLVQNQSQEEIEKMEAVFGSIFFMPPEQFERKTLDARSDLYSLGCVFYQALTGEYPFNGETGSEVMDAHLNHTVKPIQEHRDDLPEWACQWVMWLINRYRDDRPETAREALSNFTANDKKAQKNASRAQAQAQAQAQTKHPRLIIPSMTPETAGLPSTSPTSVVQTTIPGTAPVPHQAAAATASTATQQPAAPAAGGFKLSRTQLKIAIAAAIVVLLAMLAILVKKRNDRIRREYIYQEFVIKGNEDKVQAVPVSGNELQVILDIVALSEPDAKLNPVCKALTLATSSDGTHLNTTIATFTTSPELPDHIRETLFTKVIANRADAAIIPIVVEYAANATDEAAGTAAVMSIRNVVNEDHAPELLRIITSTNHTEVRDAAKTLMEDIIFNADNRNRLERLIMRSDSPTISGGARRVIGNLLEQCRPAPKATTPPVAHNPTPQPSTPRPTTPKPSTPKPSPQPARQANTDRDFSQDPSRAPKELDPVIKDLGSSDQSRVIQAITTLGEASHTIAHGALLNYSGTSPSTEMYDRTFAALIKLNSHPEMANDGEQAKQRWLQVIWRAKKTEQKKKVIDALQTIGTDWAIYHLQELSGNKDAATASYARQALMNLANGN